MPEGARRFRLCGLGQCNSWPPSGHRALRGGDVACGTSARRPGSPAVGYEAGAGSGVSGGAVPWGDDGSFPSAARRLSLGAAVVSLYRRGDVPATGDNSSASRPLPTPFVPQAVGHACPMTARSAPPHGRALRRFCAEFAAPDTALRLVGARLARQRGNPNSALGPADPTPPSCTAAAQEGHRYRTRPCLAGARWTQAPRHYAVLKPLFPPVPHAGARAVRARSSASPN